MGNTNEESIHDGGLNVVVIGVVVRSVINWINIAVIKIKQQDYHNHTVWLVFSKKEQ